MRKYFQKGSIPPQKGKGKTAAFVRAHVGHESDDCLIWPFYRDDKGYGTLGHNGKMWKAHRMMCVLAHGEPPSPKHQASHTCGNGHLGCFNPRHLCWKTNSQNQRDRRAHGRQVGQPWGRAGKLSSREVAEIQAQRGITPIRKLAERYGVKRGAIDYWHKKARLAEAAKSAA